MEEKLTLWISRLERLSAWSAGALVVVNVGDILMGIFFRYVLHSSIIWTAEVARFSLVWLVLLGACGALYHGDHMSIDFVVPHLPPGLQWFLGWIKRIITVGMLLLMIWLGFVNAWGTWHMRTMALGIPKTIPLLSIPIGLLMLLLIYILMELLRSVQRRSVK